MKLILALSILLLSGQLYAQPSPKSTFYFTIKADTLSFKKNISNFYLKIVKGGQKPFHYSKNFTRSDFKRDTLSFSITAEVYAMDTLVFDLINRITKKKTKVVLSNFSAYAYYVDLKEIYKGSGLDGALFFDLLEISALLKENNQQPVLWKSCTVQKDARQYIHIKVNDFGLGSVDGFLAYSWKKTQDRKFHNYCYDLEVKNFFRIANNSLSGKFIFKRNAHFLSGNSDVIVARYQHKPTARDRRNKLFGHSAAYTFYKDHTFLAEISNPPTKISLLPPHQVGIGTWEIQGDKIILNTPENWLSIYDKIHQHVEPIPFYNLPFKIKGNKLVVTTKNSTPPYTLKKRPTFNRNSIIKRAAIKF